MKTILNLALALTIGCSLFINVGYAAKADSLLNKSIEKKQEVKKEEPSSDEKCFDENTHVLNLGVGFGGGNYYASAYSGYGYSYNVSPAFSITYEQTIKQRVGPGYIGVGGYMGYQGSSSTYNYSYDDHGYIGNYYSTNSWSDFMIAARGAYHWDVVNKKKVELYAGALLGLRIQTYRYTTNNPDPNYHGYWVNNGSVFPAFSVFVGGRWYFAKNVGLFAEVGYGISYLTGGISFKF
ncbi:MAG TPA: hypothetical protein VF411_01530 [Bacteroidia bacterium]